MRKSQGSQLFAAMAAFTLIPSLAAAAPLNFVRLKAADKHERSRIVDLGVDIEAVTSDSVYSTVTDKVLARIRHAHVPVIETFRVASKRTINDFPQGDSRFHNYERMSKALEELVAAHPGLLRKFSIGKSLEGRDLWCVELNTSAAALARAADDETVVAAKPGVVFMGNHHAREHVSAEMPLMLLEYLVKNYGADKDITRLVDSRDIYFIPMVNPDGVEYDIATGSYRWQRKNMRTNGTDQPGVDLNRNYGFKWGTGGSSSDPSDETYMGPAPFSEPETQAIKAFVEGHPNLKTLLTFHTYSELVLYPWGHRYEPIDNKADHDTFDVMARKMASWNHYTPEQSSALYIASGDTTDWAYGQLGIFAFTFELSPNSEFGGGFYPGAGILDKVFQDNLKPALYLAELADDPHRALGLRDEDLEWLH